MRLFCPLDEAVVISFLRPEPFVSKSSHLHALIVLSLPSFAATVAILAQVTYDISLFFVVLVFWLVVVLWFLVLQFRRFSQPQSSNFAMSDDMVKW